MSRRLARLDGPSLLRLAPTLLLLLASCGYLLAVLQLSLGTVDRPGVGFFPTIVAVVLVAAAVGSLVSDLTQASGSGSEANGDALPFGEAAWRIPVLVGVLIFYVVMVGTFGHLITAGIVCTVVIFLVGRWAPWACAVGGFAVSGASFLVFDMVLGMRLPG